MSFFSLHFKKNFECQVGGVGQKINFFLGGGAKVPFFFFFRNSLNLCTFRENPS